jgi:hypothetical protein
MSTAVFRHYDRICVMRTGYLSSHKLNFAFRLHLHISCLFSTLAMDGRRKNSRIFVFSHPRTVFNLLFRIMGGHPTLSWLVNLEGSENITNTHTDDRTRLYLAQRDYRCERRQWWTSSLRISVTSMQVSRGHCNLSDLVLLFSSGLTFQKCLDDMEALMKDIESQVRTSEFVI